MYVSMATRINALAGALLLLSPLCAAAADTCASVALPVRGEAFGAKLVRNGLGLREATFLNVDVYVAGLCLPRKMRSAQETLRSS